MDIKVVLREIFEFAEKHGLDRAELLLQVANSNDGAALMETAKATAVADATVIPAIKKQKMDEKAERHARVTSNAFSVARRHWKKQPPGYRASSREIYQSAGLDMPLKSRALTEWLIRSRTAQYDGEHHGVYVFTRTWQDDED